MTSLAMKETILGVLKSKDFDGKEVLHSSDFTLALEDLGFPMGSPVVEDILVSCKVDSQGNVDFSTFEKEIQRERRVANALPPPAKKPPTSSGAAPQPWRADVVHQNKLLSESQARKVQEHRTDLHEAFQQYTNDKMTSDQFMSYIESLGLVATRELQSVLRQNVCKELSFVQFIRALVHYDSCSKTQLDPGFAAGGAAAPASNEKGQRIRVDWSKRSGQMEQSSEQAHHGRRMVADSKGFYRSSSNVKDCIFNFGNTPDKNSATKAASGSDFTTTSQFHMRQGQGNTGRLKYSSEQKVIREQVLAALRKLDAGSISISEFQSKVFGMGIELPEVLVTLLERSRLSGRLDLRKCVQILDDCVFKVMAEERAVPPEVVAGLLLKYRKALGRNGVSGVVQLAQLFQECDLDGNGVLSFGEFKKLSKEYGLTEPGGLSEDDLRVLFLELDTDGNGSIDFREFKESIRGEISPRRRNLIQLAFKRVDRHGTGAPQWIAFEECFNASFHPDVAHGLIEPSKLFQTLKQGYTETRANEVVITYEGFVDMMTDISSMIEEDERFGDLIRKAFTLDPNGRAPAAPEYMTCGLSLAALRDGADTSSVRRPIARQGHGDCITWMQEESSLEKATNARQAVPQRKVQKNRTESSIPLDQSTMYDQETYQKAIKDELRLEGGSVSASVNGRNMAQSSSLQSVLTWNVENKKKKQGKSDTSDSSSGSVHGGGSPENSALRANKSSAGWLGNGTTTGGVQAGPEMYDTGSTVTAGSSYKVAEHDGFTHKTSKWSEYKMREYGCGEAPYGTTSAPTPSTTTMNCTPVKEGGGVANKSKGGGVRSLADMMKARDNH